MKTKLLLIFLLCGVGVVWGQKKGKCEKPDTHGKKSHVLVFDSFGEDELETSFKAGEFVKFKIKNVNIFKVNGYSKNVSSNIKFDIPEGLSKTLTNDVILGFDGGGSSEKDNISQRFTTTYNNIISDLNKVKIYTQLEDRLLSKLNDSVFVKESIVKTLAKADYNAAYDKDSMELDDQRIVVEVLGDINEKFIALSDSYNEINKDKPKNKESKISGKFQSKDGNTTIEIKNAVISQKSEPKFSKEMKEIETVVKKINSDSANVIKKAQAGIDLFYRIVNSDFSVYTAPQQLNDNINVITPELKNSKGKVVYSYNPITIKTYHAWKVDFSAGYFLSFTGNDNYSSFTNSKNIKEVTEGSKDKIVNALGGLMHVYKLKNPECWFPQSGASFGASLADNSNIGFYGGLSMFFLEKNRMVITGGYSYIKLKRLNTSNLTPVDNNPNYNFTNTSDTEIRYDNLYCGAWFFGVTYNLTSGSSEKK